MNQGTQGYSLMKKTEGRKSRDTVSLSSYVYIVARAFVLLQETEGEADRKVTAQPLVFLSQDHRAYIIWFNYCFTDCVQV
jgi:hypothetical protein